MNQQRRSFFRAVVGLSIIAKYTILGAAKTRASLSLATAILAALLFSSCASLTPEQVNLILGLATQAAQVGTQIWIDQHPAHRQAFSVSVNAFSNAVKTGETNAVEYLNSLPTSALSGPESALYVSGNRLVVWDEVAGKSYPVTNLPPIVAALKRGMAPAPPRLPSRARSKPAVKVPGELVSPWTTNAYYDPPLTDAELDKQFEAIKAKLASRTNIASTVDVQPTPSGASVVTVRWTGRPGVYCVQQRDEGSAEWLHFGYATNATSWQTGWHPNLPLGQWRVVRQVR